MGLIDTALVGRLGVVPLGAVGLAVVVYGFSITLFQALQVVSTTRVGAYADSKAIHRASPLIVHGIWIALGCGALLSAALYAAAPLVINALSSDPAISGLAVKYLRIRCWAAPASLVLYALTGGARGVKDTKTALYGALVQQVLNIGLDFYLIFGLGWGVQGAATAAVLAQSASALVVFGLLVRSTVLKLSDLPSLPSWEEAKPYLQAGWRLSLTNLAANLVGVTSTTLASTYGSATLAAHVIGTQLVGLAHQYFLAFHIAALSLVSIELGNQDFQRAKDVLARIIQVALLFAIPAVTALWFQRARIPLLFTQDAATVRQATMVLPLIILYMPFDALGTVSEGGLLGALETGWVARRTTASAVLALAALFAARRYNWGLLGVYLGLRLLNIGTLVADLPRWLSPMHSPLSPHKGPYNP